MAKNKLVELFKDSFVLDVLRLRDIKSLTIKDMMGIRGDISNSLGQLLFGKYRLIIIWDKGQEGLCDYFKSDEEMARIIKENVDYYFAKSIQRYDDYIYLLNIATVESHCNFDVTKAKVLLSKQIKVFIPFIQKFIVDALTDTLDF